MAHQPMALAASSFTRFGDFLKYLRRRAQLTQTDVAIAVGYSTMQISRLEQNKRRPDLATIMALFVPALHLESEPDLVARMMHLAAEARGEALSIDVVQPQPEAMPMVAIMPEQPYRLTTGGVDTALERVFNLPVPLTSLIGRAEEVATVCASLERDATRLLTLTGPPGIGKTRLSIQVAIEMEPLFPTGIVFVALAAVREPEFVVAAIAQALRVQQVPGQTLLESVKNFLLARRLLLVLDNFEQVLNAAPLVAELLEAAASLKVLVSSRILLQIYGEHEFSVPPLLDFVHL